MNLAIFSRNMAKIGYRGSRLSGHQKVGVDGRVSVTGLRALAKRARSARPIESHLDLMNKSPDSLILLGTEEHLFVGCFLLQFTGGATMSQNHHFF